VVKEAFIIIAIEGQKVRIAMLHKRTEHAQVESVARVYIAGDGGF
jgi:hypothetical protein